MTSPRKSRTTNCLGKYKRWNNDQARSIAQGMAGTSLREPVTGPFRSSKQHGSAQRGQDSRQTQEAEAIAEKVLQGAQASEVALLPPVSGTAPNCVLCISPTLHYGLHNATVRYTVCFILPEPALCEVFSWQRGHRGRARGKGGRGAWQAEWLARRSSAGVPQGEQEGCEHTWSRRRPRELHEDSRDKEDTGDGRLGVLEAEEFVNACANVRTRWHDWLLTAG